MCINNYIFLSYKFKYYRNIFRFFLRDVSFLNFRFEFFVYILIFLLFNKYFLNINNGLSIV